MLMCIVAEGGRVFNSVSVAGRSIQDVGAHVRISAATPKTRGTCPGFSPTRHVNVQDWGDQSSFAAGKKNVHFQGEGVGGGDGWGRANVAACLSVSRPSKHLSLLPWLQKSSNYFEFVVQVVRMKRG